MKKFVLVSVAAGVVYAILIVIFALISRVADQRLTSFFFGFAAFMFWDVFWDLLVVGSSLASRLMKFVFLFVIIAVVSRIAIALLASVQMRGIAGLNPSLGWLMLGFILCAIAKGIVGSLRTERKARLAEKQRKARIAELVNKSN